MAQNFCTSYSFSALMPVSAFSCPSTTLVCSAVYSSEALMPAGAASKALNIEVHSGDTGTRILKPFRSSGLLMGLADDVIWRKPLSKMRSMASRLALPIWARM